MKIIVSGSLAYDRIMHFPGYFSDHIIPEKIKVLNVAFQVNDMEEKFGGTAGNIVYTLALLGEKPFLSASIGRDYHQYLEWLEKNEISFDGIKIVESEVSAGAYITTDQADNQITLWNPGAMNYSSEMKFDKLEPEETLVIVSPGNLDDMMNYPLACKERGIDYIFDPGQSLPMLNAKSLIGAIEGCRILICNDYELNMIMSKTELDQNEILTKAKAIIVTLGELGSKVIKMNSEINIPAVKIKEVKDPTGAGDSYRGGLISGLVRGKDLVYAAKLGSVSASFAVECNGTQGFKFTEKEFENRLKTL